MFSWDNGLRRRFRRTWHKPLVVERRSDKTGGYVEVVDRVEVSPQFRAGQLVHHRSSDFVGVVVDVDTEFTGTEAWYAEKAESNPPKDRPWYHVLVDGSRKQMYVAERQLEPVDDPEPIDHPWLKLFFDAFVEGSYVRTRPMN
jgi:heat shock protein HspQ